MFRYNVNPKCRPDLSNFAHVLVADDPTMSTMLHRAIRAASSNVSILITGETGTGKEVLARYIHFNSARANSPFVAVNCAAIPEQLLESELFGHERGSFTGAISQRIGKIESSHQGTLLLDEVSEMDRMLQAKLLRAIQEREVDRVGGSYPVPVDLRIIATTNRNILDEGELGRFRKDLFFRLAVVSLHVPSLRDHPGDIIPLAEHFIRRFRSHDPSLKDYLSEGAKATLLNYSWPGNIRELENTIQRALVMSSCEMIGADDLELGARHVRPLHGSDVITSCLTEGLRGRQLHEIERDVIIGTLKFTQGNRAETSRILGLSVRSLRNKINNYASQGIQIPRGRLTQTPR